MSELTTTLRLVGLSLHAGLLSAGAVPWLVWAAYVLVAAGQEPAMLRTFEIHLVSEAIWLASAALLLLLSVHLRVPRQPLAHVLAVAGLTTGVAVVACVTASVLEGVRRLTFAGVVDWRIVPVFTLTLFATALCASLFAGRPTFARLLHTSAQAVLAVASVVRSPAADWPWSQMVATMACSVSAVAAAAVYCKQKS